ncbi:hypothetical protein [Maricaulis maris]|uniref:Uncharacterized protein n=1 Tax=Maricaulis maris TaxID=74318 RepID=A0A495D3E7_9PROT|nr:hypothetical protein [Maricaulis maris]RKQ96412.1 hypothetical protein C7435_1742 [Maricaulis maris]
MLNHRGPALLVAVLAMISWAYLSGRVDGWERRDAAQDAADLAAITASQTSFMADLQVALEDGEATARLTSDWAQTIGGIRNEIARISTGIDCPSDPDRSLLVDRAVEEANAALRAAGAQPDGAPTAGGGDFDSP